jgi:hypothetical protein
MIDLILRKFFTFLQALWDAIRNVAIQLLKAKNASMSYPFSTVRESGLYA